ncbi:MAG: hypothetical protein IJ458_00950 [Clostridia bacterium]|nr:hypothetical protein [Clostridia bacterium]
MSKTQTGKLTFGPVWDFDWSMSSKWINKPYQNTEIGLVTSPFLLTNGSMLDYFIKDQDNFNLLCQKWNDVKDDMQDVCDSLVSYKNRILSIAIKDANYWYKNSIYSKYILSPENQVKMQYDYVVDFLGKRISYLTQILIESNYEQLAK